MPNPWFRLYHEFADDPKVQVMTEDMQRRLIMLFCDRCRDVLVTFSEQDIAFHWRITREQLSETKALFIEKGFIDDDWNVLNWNARQYISDSSTERTRRYRERVRTSQACHSDAIDTEADTEQIKKQTQKKPAASGFVLPIWIDPDIWITYLEVRASKRAAKTPRAWQAVVRQLEKFSTEGHDPNEILETSIRSNWTDVYAPKLNGSTRSTNGFAPKPRPNDSWMSRGDFTPEQAEKIKAQLAAKQGGNA